MKTFQLFIKIIGLTLFVNLTISQSFYFDQKAYYLPHPDKAYRGGQDAYFTSSQVLIVADGVGGWNDVGIDPSKYSRFLCQKGGQLFQQNTQYYSQNPLQLMKQCQILNTNPGSATMQILSLTQSTLRTCLIGDSGFLLIRYISSQPVILYQAQQQQHSFNYPYQLGYKKNGDNPNKAICQDFQIIDGDLLVVGTDGLFDNVYPKEILQALSNTKQDQTKLFSLAEVLAHQAQKRGKDKSFWSPFANNAKKHDIHIKGGKLDDTTVIIAKIKKSQTSTL